MYIQASASSLRDKCETLLYKLRNLENKSYSYIISDEYPLLQKIIYLCESNYINDHIYLSYDEVVELERIENISLYINKVLK